MCEIKVGPTRVWSCKIVTAWRNWHDLAGRKNAILTLKGTVFTCPLISRFRNSYYTAWHSPIFEKRLRMSVIWLIRDLYLVKILPLPSTGNDRKFFPVSTFGWDFRDSQACMTSDYVNLLTRKFINKNANGNLMLAGMHEWIKEHLLKLSEMLIMQLKNSNLTEWTKMLP
jgi:hypothetical protein